MSSLDITLLLEMGFSKDKAEKALSMTGNQGVEAAMEWLLAHNDELDSSDVAPATATPTLRLPQALNTSKPASPLADATEEAPAEAKSLKCDDCGRLFTSNADVERHAIKSGHNNFSQSTEEKKPLTEEEKKEQLRLVEEKLKEKRKEREEKEKVEALEREKARIKAGKEIAAAKKKLEDTEMKKLVDQRKREKEDEKLARQRVKNMIEADKLARRIKYGQETAPETAKPTTTVVSPPPSRDYTQAKLQIRLTNGQAITQTFGSKEQLSAVRLYIEMNRTDGIGAFNLMTNFPKKVFTDDDYEKPLDILGLVPSAVIIVSKALQF